MSREHLIPEIFSHTNKRDVPTWATILPAVLGFGLTFVFDGDFLMSLAVFGAVISYALMMLSHIVLRRTRPRMLRPYRTPGGIATSIFAFLLSIGAIAAQVVANFQVALITVVVLSLFTVAHLIHERYAPRSTHYSLKDSLPHVTTRV